MVLDPHHMRLRHLDVIWNPIKTLVKPNALREDDQVANSIHRPQLFQFACHPFAPSATSIPVY